MTSPVFSKNTYSRKFYLSSYSKHDLKMLKSRLISELRRVRRILNRVQSLQMELNQGKKRVKKRRTVALEVVAMKKCREALMKLMNLRSAVPFNQPVDADLLQLPDYFSIIKRPMDLGTIKSKLQKNCYRNPKAFADDVRLTFDNAMLYNHKGSKVYVSAQKLLMRFQQLFEQIDENYKPRGMRMEEKRELGKRLQEIPPEVAGHMVSILRGRNPSLMVEDDEIEFDVNALDVETLWELERFVANYKNRSKMIDEEQIDNHLKKHSTVIEVLPDDGVEINTEGDEVEVEEDIDIGEEVLGGNYPSVEIEKDVPGANNSGSSSIGSSSDSDSLSATGSDSSGSSSSDSGEGCVQSPFANPTTDRVSLKCSFGLAER